MGAHHDVRTSGLRPTAGRPRPRAARAAAVAAALTATAGGIVGASAGVASASPEHHASTYTGEHRWSDASCRSGDQPTDASTAGVFDDWSDSWSDDEDCAFADTPRSSAGEPDRSTTTAPTTTTSPAASHTVSHTTSSVAPEHPARANPLDVPPPVGQVRMIKLPVAAHR